MLLLEGEVLGALEAEGRLLAHLVAVAHGLDHAEIGAIPGYVRALKLVSSMGWPRSSLSIFSRNFTLLFVAVTSSAMSDTLPASLASAYAPYKAFSPFGKRALPNTSLLYAGFFAVYAIVPSTSMQPALFGTPSGQVTASYPVISMGNISGPMASAGADANVIEAPIATSDFTEAPTAVRRHPAEATTAGLLGAVGHFFAALLASETRDRPPTVPARNEELVIKSAITMSAVLVADCTTLIIAQT
eukprot:CAMPEP_0118931916 /NCGR_PEP_ID=MMETSP1169-20130426/8658_1 /TAXON_ID=36882 /ORGANISM="Pyramimonas obovata, Strain CCMP722" /LENGTH=244 /DNA_ID=CAMNT_0006874493 /DNA_START=356 /DNA_END=1091 /DNA_ORIENTATION=+